MPSSAPIGRAISDAQRGGLERRPQAGQQVGRPGFALQERGPLLRRQLVLRRQHGDDPPQRREEQQPEDHADDHVDPPGAGARDVVQDGRGAVAHRFTENRLGHRAEDQAGGQGQDDESGGDHEEHRGELVRLVLDQRVHQQCGLRHADGGRDRGVLGQRDQHRAERGDDRPDRLRQHDDPEHLGELQPDRARRLGLSGRHGVDARPDRLADERRGVDDEAEDGQPEVLVDQVLLRIGTPRTPAADPADSR